MELPQHAPRPTDHHPVTSKRLILASASPRRRALLEQIELPHRVVPADIDEVRRPGEPPHDFVQRLALEKATAVAQRHPDAVILAADTTVALGNEVLNKPHDTAEARAMLQRLSEREHQVHTGLAVLRQGHPAALHVETTLVTMAAIPEGELAAYLATGDSLDKAGGYGIQGYAARWITGIRGDYFNVMGLPLAASVRLLRAVDAL